MKEENENKNKKTKEKRKDKEEEALTVSFISSSPLCLQFYSPSVVPFLPIVQCLERSQQTSDRFPCGVVLTAVRYASVIQSTYRLLQRVVILLKKKTNAESSPTETHTNYDVPLDGNLEMRILSVTSHCAPPTQ
jgi:hypothetical protein